MATRRKLITVKLTAEQRERLERLWFYYGNYGPKTTSGNHSFIQRLLEQGIDERSLHTKRTPKSELPTPECEIAVQSVVGNSDFGSSSEHDEVSNFRLIHNCQDSKINSEPYREVKRFDD